MSWEKILKEDEPLDDERIQFLLDAIRSLEIAKKLFEEDPNAGSNSRYYRFNRESKRRIIVRDYNELARCIKKPKTRLSRFRR